MITHASLEQQLITEINGYRPPWPLRNPHVQTILGNLLKGKSRHLSAQCRLIQLSDGDKLAVLDNTPEDWHSGKPIAFLIHGLGGTAQSGTVVRPARLLIEQGIRTVRINLRGSGAGKGHARKPYNGGCSEDIRQVARHYRDEFPTSPLMVAGVSLGGNISLKFAGEDGVTGDTLISRFAAINPPADLDNCCSLLEKTANRLYEWRFVKELRLLALARSRHFGETIPHFPARMRLREFDDIYTSPRWGYSGVKEYYAKASSRPVLHAIRTQTLVISSEDDPFIDPQPLLGLADPVKVILLRYGGHLGYLNRLHPDQSRLSEKLMVDWLVQQHA